MTPAVPPHCRLVEEFMLLANMAVARKIHRTFPERALLRRHPPPQTKMLNDLVEFCDQMGLPMDFSSAGALNVSAGSTGAGEALLREGGRRPGSQGSAASASHQGPLPFSQIPPTPRERGGPGDKACNSWGLAGSPGDRGSPLRAQLWAGPCGQGWVGLGPRGFQ